MYVRWQWVGDRKRQGDRYFCRRGYADVYAILVESVRVDGKPRQRHVAYLGSVRFDRDRQQATSPHYRAWWWHDVAAKLAKLGNVIPLDQHPRIEAALAKRVPPVTDAAEVTACDLAHQVETRAEYGECRGCYLKWPEGTEGVPPRPHFQEQEPWANLIAAVQGKS
jgi:hypothetical protein